MTLADVLAQAAADLPDAPARAAGAATEWTIDGRPFAAATATTAEFRLAPAVLRAALGTPDTAPSRRGTDWIAFTPRELDRLALDRATAWFAAAYRQAHRRAPQA